VDNQREKHSLNLQITLQPEKLAMTLIKKTLMAEPSGLNSQAKPPVATSPKVELVEMLEKQTLS
jgi:hypothetical protein